MRALTLWQPWATLIAEGHKKIETRSWSTNIRGAVAIHSAKKPIKEVKKLMNQEAIKIISSLLYPFLLERLPVGYILAVGNLVDCKLIDDEFIKKLSTDELLLGDYTPGRYAWMFENVKTFRSPINTRGGQGFWNWLEPPQTEELR